MGLTDAQFWAAIGAARASRPVFRDGLLTPGVLEGFDIELRSPPVASAIRQMETKLRGVAARLMQAGVVTDELAGMASVMRGQERVEELIAAGQPDTETTHEAGAALLRQLHWSYEYETERAWTGPHQPEGSSVGRRVVPWLMCETAADVSGETTDGGGRVDPGLDEAMRQHRATLYVLNELLAPWRLSNGERPEHPWDLPETSWGRWFSHARGGLETVYCWISLERISSWRCSTRFAPGEQVHHVTAHAAVSDLDRLNPQAAATAHLEQALLEIARKFNLTGPPALPLPRPDEIQAMVRSVASTSNLLL